MYFRPWSAPSSAKWGLLTFPFTETGSSCPAAESWEACGRAEGNRDMVVRDTQRKEDLETYTETGRRGAGVQTTRKQQAHKTYSCLSLPASCIRNLFGISLYSPATSTCGGGLPLVPSLLPSPSFTWLKEVRLPCQETPKTESLFQMLITFLPNPPSASDHLI